MKMGVHNDSLAESLSDADLTFVYRPAELGAQFDNNLASLGSRMAIFCDYEALVSDLEEKLLAGDQLVFMSNGSFGALVDKRARVVWSCLPTFDGDPTFCALLGPNQQTGGDFAIDKYAAKSEANIRFHLRANTVEVV